MGGGKVVECTLCPKFCRIAEGQSGNCRIRVNIEGELKAVTFGYPCAVHIDPVEKKPLFHFHPGEGIFSIATAGCNLHCKNCQNWEISQGNPEDVKAYRLMPDDIVNLTKKEGLRLIAYTYTEPLVYYEYTLESAIRAREAGLKNVLVTAGYLNEEPLREIYKQIDATNTDLKCLDDKFYRDVCDATLKPVLSGIELALEMGVWVEITNLLIPTLNDSDRLISKLCQWIKNYCGMEVPLHFSRFFPRHKLTNLPPTPTSTLLRAREIAHDFGLKYVYIGNVRTDDGETTFCPVDGKPLIRRAGYTILENNVIDGRCKFCGGKIAGVFK